MLVSGALQVEGRVVLVDDFEHGHIVWGLLGVVQLLLERLRILVLMEAQVIATAHDHGLVTRLQRLLGQVARFVVEQSVAVATPSDALHEHARTNHKVSV